MMAGFPRALRLLDEVQHLADLERFDPARFVAALGEGDGPVAAVLDEIDRFAQKCMRIRLHQLSPALPPKLHTLLSTTIVAYDGTPPALLRGRVAGMLERIDPSSAAAQTNQICDAATRILALRAALRQGVTDHGQRIAEEQAAPVPPPEPDPEAPENDP